MEIGNLCLGFVGLGLIGGSIAKTVKRINPHTKIVAYNRTYSVLEAAKAEGSVDIICREINEEFYRCDYVFLCLPVDYNIKLLEVLPQYINQNCILTDVGSVKTQIHKAVEKLGLESVFIGGHPMAGSEKTGYEAATDRLLENAYYLITPTKKVGENAVNRFYDFIKAIGAIPMLLDYQEHDLYVSAISHTPHVISASLVHLIKDSDTPQETMKTIAAGGFKDTTRIAASSPTMWQQICMSNAENVCLTLEQYIQVLTKAKNLFKEKKAEEIYHFFDEARQYRSMMGAQKNSAQCAYELYCDIADETGAIAIFATLLAANQISIKNIGIIHNREYEQGVLHVEFYNSNDYENAHQLLVSKHYVVKERAL